MPGDKNRLVLTLDVGTSSVRAMIWDANGDTRPGWEVEIPHQMTITPDGGVETDPRALFKRTVRCIDLLLQHAGKRLESRSASIEAVGISTFWHSLMGLSQSQNPITPLYTWADTRSQAAAEKLKTRLDERAVHQRTGCMLHSSYLPAKLLWLSETQPEVFGKAHRWLSFAEYFFIRLFGSSSVSISMASATGLLNQETCKWDAEVLTALPISVQQLSDIAVDGAPAGELATKWIKRWPALKRAVWYPAWGDGACSNVGCNCTTEERMALSIGTSGALRVMLKKTGVPTPEGLWRYRLDRDRVIVGGALSNGGNLARWLDATLRTPKRNILLSAVAQLPADGHGLTVLPFLDGERSPDYRADARAAIAGMSLSTTSEQIVRAFFESVSYRFGVIYDRLSGVAPHAADIIVNGGAILNRPVWMKITCDVLGRRLTRSDVSETTSRGAALIALQSLKVIDSIEAAPDRLGEPIEPDATNHQAYKLGTARQAVLYERLVEQPLTAAPTLSAGSENGRTS